MKILLPQIRHDRTGFEALTKVNAETEGCFLQEIEIDMSRTTWFDADMCAALGAILYRLGDRLNTVQLTNIQPGVKQILSKNGFLSSYGRQRIPDKWGTTIPYQRFDVKDDRYFATYIEKELVLRRELPKMSSALLKKFRESVFEIFSNAVGHSKTELGIFSCGQFFPHKYCLDFSVVDLGIGIRQNVKENAGLDYSAEEAIAWATEGRNTTKKGKIPGGLGLKLLREFIKLNRGRISILSDSGYWMAHRGRVSKSKLLNAFPGTIVTMEIDTSDKQSYVLSSEISESDIF
ncbi:MAG TPA: ATP-binding protein [Pyrinomonadaceae bacterium]|nr:ATP-binding protein [Pyrinomonadaceae bacterium]